MRKSSWTPSIVPNGDDQNVYLVVDDFGRNGSASRETDVEAASLEATIMGLLQGEFSNPLRVVAFNTAEKWSQDVSEDVAHEIRRRCDLQACDVPSTIQDFVEIHEKQRSATHAESRMSGGMKLAFAILSLAMAPAFAQGISNKRGSSGNLPRDKGGSTASVQRGAIASTAVSQTQPSVPGRARGPGR